MREHEVPTHVQAEDRVLLGLTFPQIVAVTAVCAISYGAYRYAPVGPSEVRMAPGRRLRTLRRSDGRGEDWRSAAAPGGRRPAEVPAGGAGLRRADRPAGEERAARAGAAGEERPRPAEPDGETRRARAGEAAQAQEDPQEQGTPQRKDALVRQAQGKGRREPAGPRPPGRDAGDEAEGNPAGGSWPSRPWAVLAMALGDRTPGRPGRRPRAPGGTRSTSRSRSR